ncbi:hypothetical protein P7K49_035119 [Saguinus oedipus]|uniref:ENTH domain-containing protein n=1 Tax=Saguinus oedipus TaxID=9490 RepID=A0ABQ9TYF8_SAGOE|nr:hypothetical protein P7K49_035119 [Saguinus oedipus]
MSTSSLRRQMKNIVHNYSEAEIKVREATSNDPWGPSSSLMSEIADLTYNVVAFSEIMSMIWKRLNDHGKNWRHVYKVSALLSSAGRCRGSGGGMGACVRSAWGCFLVLEELEKSEVSPFVECKAKESGAWRLKSVSEWCVPEIRVLRRPERALGAHLSCVPRHPVPFLTAAEAPLWARL